MNCRGTDRLRLPRECPVSKANSPAVLKYLLEECRDRFALDDRVCRDECPFAVVGGEVLECLRVPTGGVVQASDVITTPKVSEFLGLLGAAADVSQERGVACDDRIFGWGADRRPIGTECVADDDGGLLLDGEPVRGVAEGGGEFEVALAVAGDSAVVWLVLMSGPLR